MVQSGPAMRKVNNSKASSAKPVKLEQNSASESDNSRTKRRKVAKPQYVVDAAALAPKARKAFALYVKDKWDEEKENHDEANAKRRNQYIMKALGEKWKDLDDEAKMPYIEQEKSEASAKAKFENSKIQIIASYLRSRRKSNIGLVEAIRF